MKIDLKLITLVNDIYELEREMEMLKDKLSPLKETLMKEIDIGKHQVGEHIVTKFEVPPTEIKAHIRAGYIRLQVK